MPSMKTHLESLYGSAWHEQSIAILLALSYTEGAVTPVGAVTPTFIGQRYYDTVTGTFYVATGAANTDWATLGNPALSETELGFLNGATAGQAVASKVMVVDASGDISMVDNGHFKPSIAVVAAAGTTAADAAVLADENNAVTGGDGTKGVALPAAAIGLQVSVVNASTSVLKVYPVNGGNDNINDLAEDAAFSLGPQREAIFIATSATKWYTPENANGSVEIIIPIAGNAKVGATAGWVITGGTDIDHATLPASQTNSTLVVGIPGLQVGDIVTAFAVGGQVESAGGNVTLTASLRKVTNAAADNTDAEIATDNVGTLTADTKLTSANLGATLGTAEVMAADEKLYLLLTGTTAASTDIDITHLTVTVTRVK